ncbi:putative snoRNA binding domain-containing protein, partial [Helicosporidium sp. ATCC 50920]
MSQFLLFESASGFGLFEVTAIDEIGHTSEAVQQSVQDIARFGKAVKLTAFKPFTSAANALEQINAVSESQATDDLKNFLTTNLPKVKKSSKLRLGVSEPKLGSAIAEATGIPCECNESVGELLRGVRAHFGTFVKGLDAKDAARAQLGLAHSYSRAKVKFNVNKSDNMIIQAIALLDTLDKDVNTFVMRVREWFGWHFPELVKIVPDNYQYAQVVLAIGDKASLADPASDRHDAAMEGLRKVLGDEDKVTEVVDAAKMSMGQDISPIDLVNIESFARRVIELAEYRARLGQYLNDKMVLVAPNLAALVGDLVGARLISHAGSLTNLAKYPASTVQILGAEKALFRALKTKGNTPKYGLIFHSSFIGRAKAANKGRISRYLANKCSIASRIDAFADEGTDAFGQALRQQVEERLRFYDEGLAPTKNTDAMAAILRSSASGSGDGAWIQDELSSLAHRAAESVLVEDRRAALGALCEALTGHPSARGPCGSHVLPTLLQVLSSGEDADCSLSALECLALCVTAEEDGAGQSPYASTPGGSSTSLPSAQQESLRANAEQLVRAPQAVSLLVSELAAIGVGGKNPEASPPPFRALHALQALRGLALATPLVLSEKLSGAPGAVGPLLDALSSPHDFLRIEAVRLLGSLAAAAPEL